MLFNSIEFFTLVFVTAIVFYLPILRCFQVETLMLSSFIFYGYSQPWLLLLLILSGSITATTSYYIYHNHNKSYRKFYAAVGVIGNLFVLALFKYNNLISELFISDISNVDGIIQTILTLPLPIGISFYTFQGISLAVDTYREEQYHQDNHVTLDKNFLTHYKKSVFFIAFFPQLVAGPIVKAHDFFPQIKPKFFSDVNFPYVFRQLITGYFLKSVIADNISDQTFLISPEYFESLSSVDLVVLLYGYSMQIFSDFAGYSLIAIGIAAIFGYRLPTNFNYPYISASITEFWRRWHISLSSWLKEYLYFSLGGNRNGNIRTYFNLMTVMFLGGLWHGAAWSYAVWGMWHGIGLAIERFWNDRTKINAQASFITQSLKIFLVFWFVTFGWLLFKLPEFSDALDYLQSIAQNTSLPISKIPVFIIILYSLPVLAYHALHLMKTHKPKTMKFINRHDYIIFSAMLFFLLFNRGEPGAFVYFQF